MKKKLLKKKKMMKISKLSLKLPIKSQIPDATLQAKEKSERITDNE